MKYLSHWLPIALHLLNGILLKHFSGNNLQMMLLAIHVISFIFSKICMRQAQCCDEKEWKKKQKMFFFAVPLEHPLILFISIIVNDNNNITDDVGKVG